VDNSRTWEGTSRVVGGSTPLHGLAGVW
jgi:hypothetical protein